MKEGEFTRKVALAIASLGTIAMIGWGAATTLNTKADAAELRAVIEEVQSIRELNAARQQRDVDIDRRLGNIEKQLMEIAKALRVPIVTE